MTSSFSERELRHAIAILLNDISRYGRRAAQARHAPAPQTIFERARRLYTETIPALIERERSTGKGWDGAAGYLSTLWRIDAITKDEFDTAWASLTAAMLEYLRGAAEEASSPKNPLRASAHEGDAIEGPAENTVLLLGPAGIGKSLHARELADALGLKNILDDWNGRDRIPANTLALGYPEQAGRKGAQRVIEVKTTEELLELLRPNNTAPATSA